MLIPGISSYRPYLLSFLKIVPLNLFALAPKEYRILLCHPFLPHTTNALTNEGVPELLQTVEKHRAWLEMSGQLEARRRERAAIRIRDVVDRELRRVAWNSPTARALLDAGVENIARGEATPYSAADEILEALLR